MFNEGSKDGNVYGLDIWESYCPFKRYFASIAMKYVVNSKLNHLKRK